jgi:hypothetical protein
MFNIAKAQNSHIVTIQRDLKFRLLNLE